MDEPTWFDDLIDIAWRLIKGTVYWGLIGAWWLLRVAIFAVLSLVGVRFYSD